MSVCFFHDLKAKASSCGGLCGKLLLGYSEPWSGMTSAVSEGRESVAQGQSIYRGSKAEGKVGVVGGDKPSV